MGKEQMIGVLRDRGFKTLKVKQGGYLHGRYGANCPIEHCPEAQIRAVYMSGKHCISARVKATKQGQLEFQF